MIHPIQALIYLLMTWNEVSSCQPPMASFQQQSASVAVPASPQFAIPENNLVSGVQSHLSSHPTEPIVLRGISGQALTLLEQNDEQTITPYPGYIPPPPEFPTLIQNIDEHSPSRHPTQEISSLQRVSLDEPVGPPGNKDDKVPGSTCNSEFRSLKDVTKCIRILPPLLEDEKAMHCNFQEGSACRFQPTSPPFQVGRLSSPLQYLLLTRLAKRPPMLQPEGDFLFMMQSRGLPSNEEIVITTPITCQEGNGILKFDYWIISNVEVAVRVCTQDHQYKSCTQSIRYAGSPSVAIEVVHPNATVFDIEIVVANLVAPVLLIIDNIDYKADLCDKKGDELISMPSHNNPVESFFDEKSVPIETSINSVKMNGVPSRPNFNVEESADVNDHSEVNSLPTTLPPRDSAGPPALHPDKKTSLPIKKLRACELLNCTFTSNLCGYKNYKNNTMSLAEWRLGNERVGNIHTGIRNGVDSEGFLYVGTDSSSLGMTMYILESPSFTLTSDAKLSIDVYRKSRDITLQICLGSPFYCPYSVPFFEKGVDWKQGVKLTVPSETKKIYLKAIQWRKFKWLAIDNIQLYTGQPCELQK